MLKNKYIFVATVIILFLVFCGSIFAQVSVKGYYRKDGTYVRSHTRTKPDENPYNNYSYPGNYNPNTDKISTGNTETYLKNYNKQLNYSTSKIQINKNEQPVVKIVRQKVKSSNSTSYTYPTYKYLTTNNTKPRNKPNTNINNIDVPSIPSIKPPPLKVIYSTGSSSSYNNNDSQSRLIDIPINKNNEIINTIPVIEDYFNTNNSINSYVPSIPSSKTYDYSVSGYGDDGYISGDITVDQNGGDGYIFDDYGNEKYIEVDWTGYGTLEGYDDDGNYYELDVD